MADSASYAVTLYRSNGCVTGVYGPFADPVAADMFGRLSGAIRYRVNRLQQPQKHLFDAQEKAPARRDGGPA